ncbi:hypothetical protein C4D60_Mb06t10420 [Musa balbisiana]|uniref:Uncharacterized protein n=1 Tax=Musa balbisiana TaxID=52838 RepID=A0A4S8IMS2_MUSBA|nr:hypothetical protein C4D60_Mb06t10420 [Musa balbisiana]
MEIEVVAGGNCLSRGLGADAARFGGPDVGDLGRRPSRSLGGRARWFGSGREEAPPQRQGEATPSRTCTQVGPGARPDPSDDQVSDVERVVLKMSLTLPDVAACRGRTVPLVASDIATGVAWRTELPQGMGTPRSTCSSASVCGVKRGGCRLRKADVRAYLVTVIAFLGRSAGSAIFSHIRSDILNILSKKHIPDRLATRFNCRLKQGRVETRIGGRPPAPFRFTSSVVVPYENARRIRRRPASGVLRPVMRAMEGGTAPRERPPAQHRPLLDHRKRKHQAEGRRSSVGGRSDPAHNAKRRRTGGRPDDGARQWVFSPRDLSSFKGKKDMLLAASSSPFLQQLRLLGAFYNIYDDFDSGRTVGQVFWHSYLPDLLMPGWIPVKQLCVPVAKKQQEK